MTDDVPIEEPSEEKGLLDPMQGITVAILLAFAALLVSLVALGFAISAL